jgi:IS5 family transposase
MTTPDFFRARLNALIYLNHPLAKLCHRFRWTEFEAVLSPFLHKKNVLINRLLLTICLAARYK